MTAVDDHDPVATAPDRRRLDAIVARADRFQSPAQAIAAPTRQVPAWRRLAAVLAVVLAVGVAWTIHSRWPLASEVAAGAMPGAVAAPADTDPPSSAPMRSLPAGTIEMSGHFIARRTARVTTTVMGRIASIPVREGEPVRAGDTLVRLDATVATADRATLESKLREQQLETHGEALGFEQARRELQQQIRLQAEGFVSTVAVERASLAVEQARMRRDMATAREKEVLGSLHSARDVEHQFVIRAPFDGQVVSIVAAVGEVVAPGGYDTRYAQTGLLTVVDPASLRVELAVQESLVHRLSETGCAHVHAVAQRTQPTDDAVYDIERSADQADRQRGTVMVYLRPRKAGGVLPVLDGEAVVRFLDRRDAGCAPASDPSKGHP